MILWNSGKLLRVRRRQHVADSLNKPARPFDGCGGLFCRKFGTGAGLVIGNGFEVVGLGKKNPLVMRKGRIVLAQAYKFDFERLYGS